jgi:diamine N-acetyltransferase
MALEKGFQELGLQRIYLIVRKNNPRAIRLYEKCGFMETGECRKEIQGIMVDLFEMALEKQTFEMRMKA